MRDNFTAKVKNILAKRVAFKCSNPDCKSATIGPSSASDKSVSIGVAAHIKAASVGGPRYDSTISSNDRADISNGIWLCQSCSAMIDKDEAMFTVQVLEKWKNDAEADSLKALTSKNHLSPSLANLPRPFADAELVRNMTQKKLLGHNLNETVLKYGKNFKSNEIIWNLDIVWYYKLKIYNNSSSGLINLKIHQHQASSSFFWLRNNLSKINNISPFGNISLDAETTCFIKGNHEDAKLLMREKFPDDIQGARILLEYAGEDRTVYFTELTIKKDSLDINHLNSKPLDYP